MTRKSRRPPKKGDGPKRPRVEPGECCFACADTGARLRIPLVNRGDAPAFVVRKPRRLALEGTLLTLWFTDRAQAPPLQGRHVQSPTTQALLPGEEMAIEIDLPGKLPKLKEVDANGDLILEPLDLAAVTEVRAIVCVADTPFYFNPTHSDVHAQTCKWGADLDLRIPRSKAP